MLKIKNVMGDRNEYLILKSILTVNNPTIIQKLFFCRILNFHFMVFS